MRARARFFLCCDGCDARIAAPPFAGGLFSTLVWLLWRWRDTERTMRRRAAADGWRVGIPGGFDLCPGCAERENRP